MTMFLVIAIAMLLIAIWFVVSALMGKTQIGDADQNQQNILIAKDQLASIEKELTEGVLNDDEYQQRKDELQKALVNNVEETEANKTQHEIPKPALWSALMLVPLISLSAYYYLGTPNAVNVEAHQVTSKQGEPNKHAANTAASMNELLAKLAAKLEKDPGNVKGWKMLGRSYMSMNRYSEAADVYAKLYGLVGDETSVLLAYADALAMSRDGKINGMPFQLVMTALKIDPNNTTGLWLSGLGYSEQGEYQKAINQWQKLLPQFAGDKESEMKVNGLIAQAKSKLNGTELVKNPFKTQVSKKQVKNKSDANKKSISVTVSLSPEFINQVNPDDMVFIYAKANKGPPMPLAAIRKQVKDLPVTVKLNDAMAMMPQMKLSSFSVVDIGARISKSGSAIGQSGDWQGIISSVSLDKTSEVNVIINSIR